MIKDLKHTPLPWAKLGNHIVSGRGERIASDILPADQDFIMRSVKNHYALINALEELISEFVQEPDMYGILANAKDVVKRAKSES